MLSKIGSQISILYLTAFFSGFATMGFEMLLGRALVPYFGGTIYTWGSLISVFLLGMSFGFLKGGWLSLKSPNILLISWLLILGGGCIAITPIFLMDTCIFLVQNIEDIRIGALISVCIFAFLPAAFFAAISPFCVRFAVDLIESAGSISGKLSACNTVGSIMGTLATSFLLIPNFGTKAIFIGIGITSMLYGIGFCLRTKNFSNTFLSYFKKCTIILCYILVGILVSKITNAQSLLLNNSLLEKAESEYNNIFVLKQNDFIYMNFGYRGSQYVESVFNPASPKELVVGYTRLMPLGLLYIDTYERAAFIGLGGGRTASYIIRTIPEINLDVAEIDKEVIRLAKKYFNVEESERLKIVAEDGRVFLTRSKEKYDIVFLDAYRGPFVPFHLLTKEFFQLIKSKMKEGGVVVQNVEPSTMLLDSALRTIGSVFPQVDTFSNSGNVVVIGYNSSKLTHDQIRKKAEEFDQKYKPLYSTESLLKFRKDMDISDSAKVLTDDFAPVEMLNTIKRHNQKWQ